MGWSSKFVRAARSWRPTWRSLCVAVALLLSARHPATAQDAVPWLTGPALARRLAEPADVEWKTGATLRDSLGRLSRAMHAAIVLDRRIDPSREVDVSRSNTALLDVLNAIADRFNLRHAQPTSFPRPAPAIAVKPLGSVVYIGPKSVADNLRTIAEVRRDEVRKLPAAQAERLNARAELRWEELATPRQIMADLAKRSGVAMTGVEELVPHDHWPAGDWPAMSFVEQLTLLAAQFDLTFRVAAGGKQVRLVKLTPDDVKIERTHTIAANAQKVAEAWRAACPDAEIRQTGNKISVRGRLEDHEWLTSPTKTKTAATPTKGKSIYTYTVKNKELGVVIRHLAEQLNLKLKMDEEMIGAAGIDLKQLVTFSVKDAPIDKLFEAALPVGLKWKTQGSTLEISPLK